MRIIPYIAAATMILAALGALLLPLLCCHQRQSSPRGTLMLALCIAFGLPLATIGLYIAVGTPAVFGGLNQQDQITQNIDRAIDQLRAHLHRYPRDKEGWLLLAHTAITIQQADMARAAYSRVLGMAANNTQAMIGWAEADAMLHTGHGFTVRARHLLKRAVQQDPDNQRGLWFLGLSQFQQQAFAKAAASWRLLQKQLTPGSALARAINQRIALAIRQAKARANRSSIHPGTK